MEKLHVFTLVVLFLTMATLSGCMVVPVPVDGQDDGRHNGNRGHGNHSDFRTDEGNQVLKT